MRNQQKCLRIYSGTGKNIIEFIQIFNSLFFLLSNINLVIIFKNLTCKFEIYFKLTENIAIYNY